MKHLSINRTQRIDRDAVVALLVAQTLDHGMETSHEQLVRIVDQLLADERHGFLLVAKWRGEVVGVAYVAIILSMEHSGPVGWLEDLYVTPKHRERGIGGALLDNVIMSARELGLAALDLEVDVEHRRAESLYERFGFRSLPRSRWVKDRL